MSQGDVCPSCHLQVGWSGDWIIYDLTSAPAAAAPWTSVLNLAIRSPARQWKEAMPWFMQCAGTHACRSPESEIRKSSLEHKYLRLGMQGGEVNLYTNIKGGLSVYKKKVIFLWDPHIVHWFYKPKEKGHSDGCLGQETALHHSKVSKPIPVLSRTKCFELFFFPVV